MPMLLILTLRIHRKSSRGLRKDRTSPKATAWKDQWPLLAMCYDWRRAWESPLKV